MSIEIKDLDQAIESEIDDIIEIRHKLHQHPQVRYKETYANEIVRQELDKLGIPYDTGLAETGVVAWLIPKHLPSGMEAVGLRADMDALPINELTDKPYKSQYPGFMHACGHDAHTAMLLGAARVLSKHQDKLSQPIKFIFQPAEEGGLGAKRMIEADVLTEKVGGIEVKNMFALHGWPHLSVGKFQLKPGVMFAMVGEVKIVVKGAGGHVSNPHLTHDPIVAAANIVSALQTVVSRNLNPNESAVVSITEIHGGEGASNITPDTVTLIGNLRILHLDLLDDVIAPRITTLAQDIAKAFSCEAEVEITSHGEPVVNDPHLTRQVEGIISQYFGDSSLIEMRHPLMTAEDFAFYGDVVPSCIVWVGLRPENQDSYPDLHNSKFDFNDDALPLGIKLHCLFANNTLS